MSLEIVPGADNIVRFPRERRTGSGPETLQDVAPSHALAASILEERGLAPADIHGAFRELTARQAVLFSLFLIPISLVPFALHMAGAIYAAGALAGSLGLLTAAVAFHADRSDLRARRLFLGSITYLPLLWVLLIVDRR